MTDQRDWHFKVREARCSFTGKPGFKYLAWCARTPDLRDGPISIDPAEDVHFEFGATAEEALAKLKREVLN